MKDKKNTKENINNKKKTFNKGFTLVELLAVLAILSLVVTVIIYTTTNVINKAKEESYKVTVNNIENDASAYVYENSSSSSWIGIAGGYEYQCVTVQNLIDKGYFKGDVLESEVEKNEKVQLDNYIYLERDKNNKTITKQILLYGERLVSYGGLCQNINTDGLVEIDYEPIGWAREKTITIKYNLYNNMDKVSNYVYSYDYDTDSTKNESDNFDNRVVIKTVRVNKNGTLNASIKDKDNSSVASNTQVISGIDDVRPKIDENYTGDYDVSGSVIIPIKLTDNESGVDGDSFTKEDIKVTIGGKEVTNIELKKIDDNNYELTISENEKDGNVEIIIEEDKVLDKVGNGNDETILTPEVKFSSKYTISYDSNGGEIVNNETSKVVTYNKVVGELATATRTGYTFNGWNSAVDGSGTTYTSSTVYKEVKDITLYAQWTANTYTISYSYNNGTAGSNAPTSGTYDSVLTINNPSKTVMVTGNANGTGATVGSKTSGRQTFAGWTYSNGTTSTAKYGTSSSLVTTSWSMASTKVTAQYFKNLRSMSGTVTLTANWTSVAFKLPTVTKTGYTCQWNTKTDGSGTSYASGASYTPSANGSTSITMYAICTVNKVYIRYDTNGGTIAKSAGGYTWTTDNNGVVYRDGTVYQQTIDYGSSADLANWNNTNYINVTYSGHAVIPGTEWICLSGCTTENKIFNHSTSYSSTEFCNVANGDCTVTVGVNWKTITYKQYTTNGSWYIWSIPGIIWNKLGKENKSSVVLYNENSNGYTIVSNTNAESYIKKYAMGAWGASKKIFIRTVGEGIIYQDDIVMYKASDGENRPFIRVWAPYEASKPYDTIKKDGTRGCLYDGAGGYATLSTSACDSTLESVVINDMTCWSVWVPWSCSNKNCPNDNVSLKEFSASSDIPGITEG